MHPDKWHLTFNRDYNITEPNNATNLLYEFAYAYPPRVTRGDCTNTIVHGHPQLKGGQFTKGVMQDDPKT